MGLRERLAKAVGNRVAPARLAHAAFDHGNWPAAIEFGLRALDDCGADDDKAELRILVGSAYAELDDAGRGVPLLQAVYDDGLIDDTVFVGDMARLRLALLSVKGGEYSSLPRLLDEIDRRGPAKRRAFAYRLRAMLAWQLRADLPAAELLLQQSVEADPPDEPGMSWRADLGRGQFLGEVGRYAEADALLGPAILRQEQCLDHDDHGSRTDFGIGLGSYGRILARLGRIAEAHVLVERGAKLLDPAHRYAIAYGHLSRMEVALASQDGPSAKSSFTEGWVIAQDLGLMPACIELLIAHIELDAMLGDHGAYTRHRSQALDLCRLLGHEADRQRIEAVAAPNDRT